MEKLPVKSDNARSFWGQGILPINIDNDFARESLGILDLANLDMGRESFIGLYESNCSEESLGILNRSMCVSDFSFGTLSLNENNEQNTPDKNFLIKHQSSLPTILEASANKQESNDEKLVGSMFRMEAQLFASRLKDGSILAHDLDEDLILDRTSAPGNFENLSDLENSVENGSPSIPSIVISPAQQKDANNSTAKEPLEMLNALSENLSKLNLTEEQISTGQSIINSLADIFQSSGSSHNKSSKLSPNLGLSTEQVLDLRKKSSSDTNLHQIESNDEEKENCRPLDLSLKPKRPQMGVLTTQTKQNNNNNEQNVNMGKIFNDKIKIRTKQPTNVKRGPMKAVVPIDKMAKCVKSATLPKFKKSTTPTRTTLKPLAQSTPDSAISNCKLSTGGNNHKNINTNEGKKGQKLNYSGELNKSLQNMKDSFLRRRHSGSDLLKIKSDNGQNNLKKKQESRPRANSFGSAGIFDMKKAKENVLVSSKNKKFANKPTIFKSDKAK